MKKLIFLSLLNLIVTFSFAQTKVESTKINLKLKTFKFVEEGGHISARYCGYVYPTIQADFQCVGFFGGLDELKKYYQELINISESEDGEYKLSRNYDDSYKLIKKGNKIEISFTSDGFYYFKKISTKNLKIDLELLNSGTWK